MTLIGTDTSDVGIGFDALNPVTASYVGKLNAFTFNQSKINLYLKKFGTGTGSFIEAFNSANSRVFAVGINGHVSASVFTGSLFGTASHASIASSSLVTDTTTGVGPYYVTFVDGTSGNRPLRVDNAALTFNATTNILTTTASQALTSSFINVTGSNAFVQGGNSFGATAVLGTNDAQSLALETNGTARLTILSGGNVGIGITNPTARLFVSQSGVDAGIIVGGGTNPNMRAVNATIITKLQSTDTSGFIGTETNNDLNIVTNNTSKIFVSSSGNVGIGTSTPASKLDVNGIIVAGSNSATEGTIVLQDQYSIGHLLNIGTNRSSGAVVLGYGVYPSSVTSNAFISSTSIALERAALSFDSNFRWYTGISQTVAIGSLATLTPKMVLENNGNLGIGVTSPSAKLEIKSSATNNLGGLLLRATTTSDFPAILYENSTNGGTLDLYNSASLTTRISSNGNSYFTSGSIGIGITAPTGRLHISGSTNSMLRIESQDVSDTTPIVYIEGNKGGTSPATAVLVELKSNADVRARGINMTTADSNARWFAGVSYNNGSTSGYQIGYDATSNRLPYYTQSSSLFIDTSGNVNIGTISANGKLTIDSGATAYSIYANNRGASWASGIRAQVDIAQNGYFIMSFVSGSQYGSLQAGDNIAFRNISLNHQGGNVGIGTTTPTVGKLQINTGAANNNAITIQATSQTSITYGIGIDASSNLAIYDNFSSAQRVTINGSGNVGIGTTTPTEGKLVVANSGPSLIYNKEISQGVTSFWNSSDGAQIQFGSSTNHPLLLFTNNTEKVRIAANGNVTIADLSGTGDRIVGTNSSGLLSSITVGSGLSLSGGTLTATGGSAGTVTGTGASTQVSYWTSTSNITGSNGFVYDNSTGNVGINTLSPYEKLEVAGAISAGGGWSANGSQGSVTTMGFQSGYGFVQAVDWGAEYKILALNPNGGNVGIGTTSPTGSLQVNGILSISNNAVIGQGNAYGTIGAANFTTLKLYDSSTGDTVLNNQGYNIQLQTAGSSKLTILNNGNVGIGTTIPAAKLEVVGDIMSNGGNVRVNTGVSTGDAYVDIGPNRSGNGYSYIDLIGDTTYTDFGFRIIRGNSGANTNSQIIHRGTGPLEIGTTDAGAINLFTGGTTKLTVLSDGNIGINETSPVTKLTISNDSGGADGNIWQRWRYVPGNDAYYLDLKQTVTSGVVRYNFSMVNNSTAYNDVLVLDRGSVGIGTTTPAYTLDVTGTIRATGDVIAYSDARVKDNVKTIENALEKVMSLRGVSYTRKDTDDKLTKIGVIAQEVFPIIPEVVSKDEDGNYSVAYGNMVGLLIEAIKEQQKQIDELKYLLQSK